MKKDSENWLKIARYDLKVADDCFKATNYLTCLEKCHNALEKLLKGIISENSQETRKIHDLLRLASEALIINLQAEVLDLFQELNSIYMSTRYPDEFDAIMGKLDKSRTELILSKTKRTFTWLEKKLEMN
jgi:HEPN domain-containing protein